MRSQEAYDFLLPGLPHYTYPEIDGTICRAGVWNQGGRFAGAATRYWFHKGLFDILVIPEPYWANEKKGRN